VGAPPCGFQGADFDFGPRSDESYAPSSATFLWTERPAFCHLQFESETSEAAAFWQRRFYDFNVWSEKKVREKLIYMHRNPVARKLVSHPKDWPWSSWSHYAKGEHGLIAIDLLQKR
jgi:hypothetical protein